MTFDSSFESGNLKEAYRLSDKSYLLLMREDTNSKGFYQWFYYSVKGMKKGETYSFQIANFQKRYSLFSTGMHPSVLSEKRSFF